MLRPKLQKSASVPVSRTCRSGVRGGGGDGSDGDDGGVMMVPFWLKQSQASSDSFPARSEQRTWNHEVLRGSALRDAPWLTTKKPGGLGSQHGGPGAQLRRADRVR